MPLFPTDKWHLVDWTLSLGSNVHVAINREWFSDDFVDFNSHVGKAPQSMDVEGVGTVVLRLAGADNTHSQEVILQNVLYVPNYLCNVIGGPIVSEHDYKYNINFNSSALILTETGKTIGFFDTEPLMHLRLQGHAPGSSSFNSDVTSHLRILVTWPHEELRRFEAYRAGEPFEEAQFVEEPPYTDAEKLWLNKNFKGEYQFLAHKRLSIHSPSERELGRKFAREAIKKDAATIQSMVKELEENNIHNSNNAPVTTDSDVEIKKKQDKENQLPATTNDDKPKREKYIAPHMRVLLGLPMP